MRLEIVELAEHIAKIFVSLRKQDSPLKTMPELEGKYINPLTDFGFKRLFGSEFNKELLISFLNTLLDGEQYIEDVTYLNGEQLGERRDSRRAIFDVFCRNDRGETFIVEMQNVYQQFFKDRAVYYSTFPIRDQAKRGDDWDFELNGVYTVGILNFEFHDGADDGSSVKFPWHHEVKLMDIDRKTVFYDKLTYIYEEIPKFTKTEAELTSMFDKWMFVLKNLSRLMERPAALQDRVFTRLFQQAEIAMFNKEELIQYEDSVKAYRDIANAIKTAERKKFAEGVAEGVAKTAKNMLSMNIPVETIAQATGLSADEIEKLR